MIQRQGKDMPQWSQYHSITIKKEAYNDHFLAYLLLYIYIIINKIFSKTCRVKLNCDTVIL